MSSSACSKHSPNPSKLHVMHISIFDQQMWSLWTALTTLHENLYAAKNKYVQFTTSPQFLLLGLRMSENPTVKVKEGKLRSTMLKNWSSRGRPLQAKYILECISYILQCMWRKPSSSAVSSEHSRKHLQITQQWLIIFTTNCIGMLNAFFTIKGCVDKGWLIEM